MLSLSAKYLRITITSLFSGYYKENLKSSGVVFANSSIDTYFTPSFTESWKSDIKSRENPKDYHSAINNTNLLIRIKFRVVKRLAGGKVKSPTLPKKTS